MNDCNNDGSQSEQNFTRVHNLGVDIIAKHNKYTNYTSTQAWAVGLGTLIGGHDVRNYDPDKYVGVELIVLALRDKFKDIGGVGVHAVEYIELLKKHYPETSSSVLRLTMASSVDNNPISPVIITNTYHPPVLQLHTQAGNDISGKSSVYTNAELSELEDRIDREVADLIFDIVLT